VTLHEQTGPPAPNGPPLRIFVVHGSPYLTDHFFHGDGLVAWGFIAELARRGHVIHVLTERANLLAGPPPNVTIVEYPWAEPNDLFHYAAYMWKARRYYRRLAAGAGVDVVHQMNPVVRGLSLALLGTPSPVVLGTYVGDWHQSMAPPGFRRRNAVQRALTLLRAVIDGLQQHAAAAVVLATPHALVRVPFKRDTRSRIRYLHHGVDLELFNPEAMPGDPGVRPQSVLYVGGLDVRKGVMTLVEAFARVVADLPQARLVLVGDGDWEDAMKRRVAELGVADRTEFAGRCDRRAVAGWMRACTLLCAPSFGEPYGQNVVEAMASGRPVVLTTEGGHPHLADGNGSLSFRPGDVEELAAALRTILASSELAERMGRANRATAERRHSWPRVTDELERIYRDAIRSQR
jgi:glycosyltransferase involved in cell wall biosynthesis